MPAITFLAVSFTAMLAAAAPGSSSTWSDYPHADSSSVWSGYPHSSASTTAVSSASQTTATPSATSNIVAASMDGQLPAQTPSNFQFSGNVRKYYVAAEEVEWDCAPTGWDNWLGVPFNDSPRAKSANYVQYGTKWLKALYRGYTDGSFQTRSPQPPFQETRGTTLRAEVGDMIEIMFCNKLSRNYASMHSMGLSYDKTNEGGDYPNNTIPGQNSPFVEQEAVPPVDSGVGPGNCVVYKWLVTWIMGPAPGTNGPSKLHSYHSYVSMYEDLNTGLLGPTIIYAPGQMTPTISTYREIPLVYMISNEAVSWLGSQNAHNTTTLNLPPTNGNTSIITPQLTNLKSANTFPSAPPLYTMNGYVFSNNPSFEMCEGDKVIWYTYAYGSASHFHMHGHDFEYEGAGQYSVSLNDGVGKTLFMNATGTGLWQVLCHVSNHLSKGMVSNYRVYPRGQVSAAGAWVLGGLGTCVISMVGVVFGKF